jgi:F0F1-type ATP synthase assembly protein I
MAGGRGAKPGFIGFFRGIRFDTEKPGRYLCLAYAEVCAVTTPEKKPSPKNRGEEPVESDSARGVLKEAKRQTIGFMSIANLGLEMAGVILGLTLLGWWIDKKTGLSPLFVLLGVLIGVTGSMYKIFKASERMMK